MARSARSDPLAVALAAAVADRATTPAAPGILARAPAAPPAPAPAPDRPKPAAPQQYEHQWENPALLASIYPSRELALKLFVTMFREVELRDFTVDPKVRATVVEAARSAMAAEVAALKAAADKRSASRIKELEETLKRDATTVRAWDDAVRWEVAHRADPLAGEALTKEVQRLIAAGVAPDWLGPMVIDYAGMRYASGHGSYFSPVRLVYLIERSAGTWEQSRRQEGEAAKAEYERQNQGWVAGGKKGRAPRDPGPVKWSAAETAALAQTPVEAVARLEQLYAKGEIPPWAWHKIVRLTELRTRYATAGWEKESEEKPPKPDPRWSGILSLWTKDEALSPKFEPAYGSTGWRLEIMRRNALITTRMVCNELSEAAQRHRGVKLPGGISGDARYFEQTATKPGAYFKRPKTVADLRPGATIFFVKRTNWMMIEKGEEPDSSQRVVAVAGATYPMPPPPEAIDEWNAWGAAKKAGEKKRADWQTRAKSAKTDKDKAALGPEPPAFATPEPHYKGPKEVPANGVAADGWTYTVVPGQAITRSKDGVTHWLGWQHQATVIRAWPDGRVFTWETTVDIDPRTKKQVSHSGVNVRYLNALDAPGVFVGYDPGDEPVPKSEPAPPSESPPKAEPAPPPAAAPASAP